MIEKLPKGWIETTLDEICSLITDGVHKTPQYIESGIPFISVTNLKTNKINFENCRFISEEDHIEYIKRCKPEKGDILMGKVGTLGVADVIREKNEFSIFVQLALLKPFYKHLNSEFIRFLILSDLVKKQIEEKKGGTALQYIGIKKIKEISILLPPLPEQKRIAEKLDCLLAKVDACKERLDKVPKIIKRFRQSVLADAVSGKLTEDWREKNEKVVSANNRWGVSIKTIEEGLFPKLPGNWCYIQLNDISTRVSVGHVGKTSEYYTDQGNGIPFLRSQNVRPGKISLEGLTFIQEKLHHKLKKSKLESGDLLVVRVGANRGDACVLPPIFEDLNCANIVFARPFKGISDYLNYYFQSSFCREQLMGRTVGAAQGVINTKSVAKIPVSVPPENEQAEIVRRVEGLFSVADRLEKKMVIANLRVKKITSSILSKAFHGGLVPQNPNDEPAELLLERIRTEREALAANKKKGGRTPNKRSGRGKKTKHQKADADSEPEPAAAPASGMGVDEEKDRQVKSKKQVAKHTEHRFEQADVLKAFRKAIFHQSNLDENTLLRLVGQRLGVNRLSKQIRHELESYIKTAFRRKIISRNGGGYDSATPTIHHYDEDYLIKALKSLIRKGYEYQRGHVVENLAVYLGYDKISDAFAHRMKTIFRLAIRRGELYRNGAYVGKF